MKKVYLLIFLVVTFVSIALGSETARAQGDLNVERYQYDSRDKVVVDTVTGKVYGFRFDGPQLKHVVIDYVRGTVNTTKTVPFGKRNLLLLTGSPTPENLGPHSSPEGMTLPFGEGALREAVSSKTKSETP